MKSTQSEDTPVGSCSIWFADLHWVIKLDNHFHIILCNVIIVYTSFNLKVNVSNYETYFSNMWELFLMQVVSWINTSSIDQDPWESTIFSNSNEINSLWNPWIMTIHYVANKFCRRHFKIKGSLLLLLFLERSYLLNVLMVLGEIRRKYSNGLRDQIKRHRSILITISLLHPFPWHFFFNIFIGV